MTVILTGYLADLDKAYDFLSLTKSEVLESYSYMTDEDYNGMLTELKANEVEILAEYVKRRIQTECHRSVSFFTFERLVRD